MRVSQLIALLNDCKPDDEVVIQRDERGGGFVHYEPGSVWPEGHIGHRGAIIMLGESGPGRSASTDSKGSTDGTR